HSRTCSRSVAFAGHEISQGAACRPDRADAARTSRATIQTRAPNRLRPGGGRGMIVLVDYASPSVFESTRDETLVGIAANARRPVRFHGVVAKHGFLLRVALRALGEAIWSNDTWIAQSDLLDPVITVHPD